ncbi:MAG: putative ABC transporter periplasmic-binding protein [Methanosaeta sp. PtaU1.Bin060]|nr:MAG: putative ABC transporter periplasmic-binding protein [Methanosaeta sp. PtaU1.Bin060]
MKDQYKQLLGLSIFLLLFIGPALSVEQIPVYTIADSTGDWGFPSPYSHYSRGPGYIMMSLIFDTLVWKNQSGYVPALADSWQIEGDSAYIFNLKKNVTWNDGEKFTAKDVTFTLDYIKQHPYQWVNSGTIKDAEALDDYTVKVNLNSPYAPFLDMVACTLPILPEHIYKSVSNPAEFQDDDALVGTGPYKLVNYDKAQGTYLYEAYDGYYLGTPKVKQLKSVKISEEMAAAALEKGDVDAISVPGDVVENLKKENFTVLEGPRDGITKIMVNHKKEPFSDMRFRQALYYAIDRQALVDNGLRGYGIIASAGLYAPDSEWYNPDIEQYGYDPSKAGDLLEQMGYAKDGQYFSKDGKPLEMEMLVTSANERVGEMIRQQLETAGFKVSLRSMDSKTLDSLVGEWQFDLALNYHGGMGGDPEILNRIIGEGYTFNSARYSADQKLNDLLSQEVSETDTAKRKELVDEVQAVHAQDLPALPLYYSNSYFAHDGELNMYYTRQGIANGIPIAENKLSFVK